MSAAFFVDISNLYHCVQKKYERKLDYQKLMDKAQRIDTISRAFAYGVQKVDEASAFIGCLKSFGYEPKYKQHKTDDEGKVIRKADWDVGITVDVVRLVKRVETIILGSSDADLVPLLQWLRNEGVRSIVLACGISKEIRDNCDRWFEISEDMLEVEETVEIES